MKIVDCFTLTGFAMTSGLIDKVGVEQFKKTLPQFLENAKESFAGAFTFSKLVSKALRMLDK